MEKAKNRAKHILSIVGYSFIMLLLVLDIFLLIGKFNSSSSGVSNFFGTEVYTVLTGSMEGSDEYYASHPEFEIRDCPIDSALFVERAPDVIYEGESEETKVQKQAVIDEYYSKLKVGDVITFIFQLNKNYIITHRIIAVENNNGVYTFILRGDNPTGDKQITTSSPTQTVTSDSGLIIGKVTGVNVFLGKFIVHFLNNKVAFGCTVLIPAGALFVYEIIRIIYLLTAGKREAREAKIKAKDEEKQALIEELRKKVEALEAQQKDKN